MKIHYSILTVLLLLATTVQAQDYGTAIGARGGLTIPSITPGGKKTPLSKGYSSRMAWGAGAFAEFRYTKTFSIQVGVEYSSQGGLKNGNQAIPSAPIFASDGEMMQGFAAGLTAAMTETAKHSEVGAAQVMQFGQALMGELSGDKIPEYLYADFKSEAKFDYIMLPVQAKWGWNFNDGNSPWRFYVGAGIFASYLISAERVSSGSSEMYVDKEQLMSLGDMAGGLMQQFATQIVTDPAGQRGVAAFITSVSGPLTAKTDFGTPPAGGTQDIYDELKKVNFGFVGNVGFQYSFGEGRRNNLFIEGGGNYGLVKIQKEDVNGQNRIGAGTVMLGYSRVLGR